MTIKADIKVVIGLGNPGPAHVLQRHNIGFRVVDALVAKYHADWQKKSCYEQAIIHIHDKKILVIKPQTFMNSSGKVIPGLQKQGIQAENILVVHDELEKKFGSLTIKQGGSHKGHNGLKSIIASCGFDFWRLRFGIGRPEEKADVPDYVLSNFRESAQDLNSLIESAVQIIEDLI